MSLEVCGCDPVGGSGFTLDTVSQAFHKPARADPELSFYDPPDLTTSFPSEPSSIGDLGLNAGLAMTPIETKPLPWAIPESVYFVYRGSHPNKSPDKLLPRQPVATAFVLSVPDSEHSHHIRFLVTARHVVDPQWAHCSEQNPASIDLRLNRRTGGVAYETLSLRSGPTRRFYTPLDSTTDLAVIPLDHNLISNIDDYKFIDVPFHLLLTESEIRLVRADQQVMTARPSAQASGEVSGYPVFDGGVLAKMPIEAVGVRCGVAQTPEAQTYPESRMLHIWFINAGVAQGVSGAPVYASIARTPGAAKTRVLLGIQSAVLPDDGIAGITPAPALGDLIRSALRGSKLKLDF